MAHPRLVIVTGKGGVGKTTVSAAVARAAVARGRSVLLIECARPGRLAHVLGCGPLGSAPRTIFPGLQAVALDDDASLEAFVGRLVPLRMLSNRLLESGTFRVIASSVPGIVEAAQLTQIAIWLDEKDGTRRPRYDVVVLDAPASGHTIPLLGAPASLASLASLGPLAGTLREVAGWLSDPERTRALVVAIPEDWAVAEALELHGQLGGTLGIPVGPPVLNAVFPRRFTTPEAELLAQARDADTVDRRLLAAGGYFVARREAARAQAAALRRATGVKPVELPFVFSSAMSWRDLEPIASAIEAALESTPDPATSAESGT